MPSLLTCLIPVYNEGPLLLQTVTQLKIIPEISNFLIIDDGSTDNGLTLLREKYPTIPIIQLKKNLGKSTAVRAGLSQLKTDLTLLFDADIRGLKPAEIQAGIRSLRQNPSISMLIFRRLCSPLIARLIRADIMLSGERITQTSILRAVMTQSPPPVQYAMEPALNQYCLDHQLATAWSPASTYNTYKTLKLGFWRGLLGDFTTMIHGAQYVGWYNYLTQITSFCRHKVATI